MERGEAPVSSSDEEDLADHIYNEPYEHHPDAEGGAQYLGDAGVTEYAEPNMAPDNQDPAPDNGPDTA